MILNKPFTRKQRADLTVYCNANNCHIEDRGEFLESVENPPYVPTTEDKIAELKAILEKDYDYKHNKYVRGEYTEAEWEVIKSEIQAIVANIRELENSINNREN